MTTKPDLTIFSPINNKVLDSLPIDSADMIQQKVASARNASQSWAKTSPKERAKMMAGFGEKLLEQKGSLAELLHQEMGKPINDAKKEILGCGYQFDQYLQQIVAALQPEILSSEKAESHIDFRPLGICGVISPWNFPIGMPHWMTIPALMAGNAVILKPSEETPLIAQAYCELLNEFLPENVLQTAHGADETGKALVNADIDLIAFTGSKETGKKILASAATELKRVMLELGGKDPLVVLKNANIDKAVDFAVYNSFRNAGQVCVSSERIYVQTDIFEEFKGKAIELTKKLKIGAEENADIGPMINQTQKQLVVDQVKEALDQGAINELGDLQEQDNYLWPIVLTNLNHDMRIMREETFGPVACIMPFNDNEEAINLANDTEYGLGAVVFGELNEETEYVAANINAGMVGINQGCGGISGTPWIGAKQSGYGFHGSKEGHRQFTQRHVITKPLK